MGGLAAWILGILGIFGALSLGTDCYCEKTHQYLTITPKALNSAAGYCAFIIQILMDVPDMLVHMGEESAQGKRLFSLATVGGDDADCGRNALPYTVVVAEKNLT